MNRTARAFAGGLTALLLLLAAPASAATVLDEARDPRDVRGRLDIVLVRAAARGDKMVLTVRTAERWRCRYLDGHGIQDGDGQGASVRWQFNTNTDPYTEHTSFFSCSGGDFSFSVDGKHTYNAWRPDRRTIKVALPAHRFGLDRQHLELHAISRVDKISASEVLFDEEDVAPALHPNRS